MPEPDRITDRELLAVERQLRQTALPLPERQRDELLYSCGVESGRMQTRRLTLRWSTAAAAMGILFGGLLIAAIDRRSPRAPAAGLAASKNPAQERAAAGPRGPDPAPSPPKGFQTTPGRWAPGADAGQLTAGSRVAEGLGFLDLPERVLEPAAIHRDGLNGQPLRPRSQFVE